MEDSVLTLRIRLGFRDSGIYVPRQGTIPLGDQAKIHEAVSKFFDTFKEVKPQEQSDVWPQVLEAARNVRLAMFPDLTQYQRLAALVGENRLVKVIADDEKTLQIPWELMTNGSEPLPEPQRFLGYDTVFHRAYSKVQGVRGTGQLSIPSHPETGMLTYAALANFAEGYEQLCEEEYASRISLRLQDLDIEGHLRFRGSPVMTRNYYLEETREAMKFLTGLDIAHLSCLLLKFRYRDEPYLVFSDAFLVSLRDFKENLRFERSPVVLFDACDNTWHLMADRFRFLTSFIELGSAAVITSFFPVPRSVAVAFSECFYEQLVSIKPTSVDRALGEARRRLVDRGELLALLFWLYGDPALAIVQEEVPHQELSQDDREQLAHKLEAIPTWRDGSLSDKKSMLRGAGLPDELVDELSSQLRVEAYLAANDVIRRLQRIGQITGTKWTGIGLLVKYLCEHHAHDRESKHFFVQLICKYRMTADRLWLQANQPTLDSRE